MPASPYRNQATDATDPGYRKAMVDLFATVSDTGDRRGFTLPVETGQFAYGGINRAEYPRAYLNPTRPVSPKSGSTTTGCATEADVLATIRAGGATVLSVGDLVTVAPAVDVRTAFNLKTMAGDALPGTQNVVTVKALGWSKPEGVRVGPSDRVNMAKMTVVANGNAPVMSLPPGSGGGWRFIGIDFRVDSAVTTCARIVQLGNGNTGAQTTSTIPFNVTFEQCCFDAHFACSILRAVEANCRAFQFLDCYWGDNVHSWLTAGDCTAWGCWNTDGPFQCANSRIVGSSEGIGLGGGTNEIAILADGDIWGNDIIKPASWNPEHPSYIAPSQTLNRKNGMEIKKGKRIRVRGNRIRQIKQNNQNPGFAVYVKDESYGDSALGQTSDIIVEYNHGSEIESGPTTRGTTSGGLEVLHNTAQVVFYSNLWECEEVPWEVVGGAAAFTYPGPSLNHSIIHDTFINLGSITYAVLLDGNTTPPSAFSTGKPTNFVLIDCVMECLTSLGIKAGGLASGTASLDASCTGYTVLKNVFVGLPSATNPANNFYPATTAAVGYTNRAGRDYSLDPGGGAAIVTSLQPVTQPAGAVSGVLLQTQPSVRALDQYGALWITPIAVTINVVSGTPVLTPQTVNTIAGVATFTTIALTGAGTSTLSANAGAIGVTFSPVVVTDAPVSLTPASLVITRAPGGTIVSGKPFPVQPIVEARNAAGHVLLTFEGYITAYLASGTGTLKGTVKVQCVAGVARFTDLRIAGSGSDVLAFTDGTPP